MCSDEHGEAKPAPSIFLAGCMALGLQAYEVAYVGDRYAIDAVGAREAGLHAFWLDRANASAATTIGAGICIIHFLDELPAALSC